MIINNTSNYISSINQYSNGTEASEADIRSATEQELASFVIEYVLRPIILLDWLVVFRLIGIFRFLGQLALLIS